MPSPEAILSGLRVAANEALALAIAWHVLAFAALLAMAAGWRPLRRAAGLLLAAPIVSVSAVAFSQGNPFNGAVLGALAVVLTGLAFRLGAEPVGRPGPAGTAVGFAMVLFGLVYPHFLESRPAPIYLVAAPVGIVPCPTLSLVIGFTLLAGGLRSRSWSVVLSVVGLFYGIFGVARLGVWLDAFLIAGALALGVMSLSGAVSTQPRGQAGPLGKGKPQSGCPSTT